jgi:tetratricopeptide (TPR) repeat protein
MVRSPEIEDGAAWSPEVKVGGAIGRFELTRELGRGGFGVVFEATDHELSRTVALKLVKAGTRVSARGSEWLLREAEAVARLNHPNIITLHDLGQGPSGPYLVFELLRGRTLHEALRGGPLPLEVVLDLALAVARALVHAHAAGVIHRDLTAANVHLAEDGTVKVLDFGLAHLFGRDGANDGGTPAYMAPEQWEGDRGDARTDLFALGVILFQCLTGRFPYRVEKGWSEVLEPGRTPRLPRSAGPARLRRLVEALLDREPELRPGSARAVRDELLAVHRARAGAGGRRALWGLAAVAAAAVGVAGWGLTRREPPPGEQVHAVVAAMENGAGEPTLDAVPGLLAAALEPSPRVKVVSASRLAYASRQAGLGEPGRIDAARGQNLARLAGAEVVLVPSSWRADGVAVVAVRAVESETGRRLFSVEAPVAGRGGLAGVVDELSDRIRRELRERAADRRLRRPVAETVTASAEAARWYYEGVDCLRTRTYASGNALQCAPRFEQALAIDPSCPLAHYQLAMINFLRGDSGEQARPHLERALRASDRFPAREGKLLSALSLRIDGRADQAQRTYDGLLASDPDDEEVLGQVSVLLADGGDWDAALRYIEKWAAVAPEEELAQTFLVEALGRLDRAAELEAMIARLMQLPRRPWGLIVEAHIWAGDAAGALAAARTALAAEGDAARTTLCWALLAHGSYPEAERQARKLMEQVQGSSVGQRFVESALVGQGRIDAALRWVDSTAQGMPRAGETRRAFRLAVDAMGAWQPSRAWPLAERVAALDPVYAADLAVPLLLMGDRVHADQLARHLQPGAFAFEEYRALVAWRAGDPASAIAILTRLEVRDPWPLYGLAPAYLLAEISAEVGDDLGTLAAAARFQRLPADRAWRAWAYTRSLFLVARAHARRGDREQARRELDQLLELLARSDRGLPIRTEALSLRMKL